MFTEDIEELKKKLLVRLKDEATNYFPDTVLIDTVSYCNLQCSMCPHSKMTRKKGIMDWDLYRKIINETAVKKPEARVWITFFGEGLILKDLPERISYAKEKGLKDVVFNTNGNLLNYENAKKMILAGLDAIYVGVDAFREDTYSRLRVGGNLKRVVKGVLEYKKALDVFGSDDQKIFVQFVEMADNKNELNDFTAFWNSRGIPVKIRPKVSWAGKVPAENLKDYTERLPCNWAMNTINIADNGLVCLCAVDLNCENVMGDINRNSISEIWNGTLKRFRLNHLNGEWAKLPEMCRKCRDWQSSYAEYISVDKG